MATQQSRAYKRSWKNLLLNKRYQLKFTLFMVILSGLLITLLGWWVMREADKATTVGINNVLGKRCPPKPDDPNKPDASKATIPGVDVDVTPMAPIEPPAETPAPGEGSSAEAAPEAGAGAVDESAKPAADETAAGGDATAAAGEGDGESAEERPRAVVTLEPSQIEPVKSAEPVPDIAAALAKHNECKVAQADKIDGLKQARRNILYVLVLVGMFLVIGLSLYGIKMTHKVAGPLFKVTTYLRKMKDGKFDEVYNLRKGDQLVEFYDHFKLAHAGVTQLQKDDVEQLRTMIEIAEAEGLGAKSPELAASIADLKKLLEEKEASLG